MRRGGLGGPASGSSPGRAESAERGAGRQAARLDCPGVSRSIRSVVCAVDAPGGAGADRTRERGLADPAGGRSLSAGLGFHCPAASATEQRDEAVRAWLESTYPAIARKAKAQGCDIQWTDETGLSSRANYGRSFAPRGQTPVIRRPGRRFSQSMISSLTNRGKLRFMIYEGALNTTIFLNFLQRLIREATRKLFVIVDNLPVHRAHRITAWVRDHADRIELFYLPPPAFAGAGPTRPSTIRTNSSTTTSSRRWHAVARHGTRLRSSRV